MPRYDPTGATYVNTATGATGGAAANPNFVAPPTATAYSATGTDVHTTSATGTGDITVSNFRELCIDIDLTAITGTSVAFIVERKDVNGHYWTIANPSALVATGAVNLDIGVGASTNKSFGTIIRIRWTSTAVTVGTADFSVIGK